MKNIIKKLALTLIILTAVYSMAYSQKLTGSVKGVVEDDEGNPLSAVLVTAASPSLLGSQSFIATQEGIFRFPSLPPGIYEISAELEGFQIVKRANVVVYLGKTTTITIVMKLSQIKEEVIVTAPSPMIDTESSKLGVSFTQDIISNLPIARDVYDIVNMSPGAISEGDSYRRTSAVHGGTLRANTYAFDGVNMNDPVSNTLMTNINFDVIDEVEMILGGGSAEISVAEGAYINIITKSGGNKFSGALTTSFSTEDFATSLWTKEKLNAMGLEEPILDKSFLDGSVSLGGPIIKDKLWFFMNGRYIDLSKDTINPEYGFDHTEKMAFGKLSYQLSSRLKLTGMFNFTDVYEPIIEGGLYVSKETTRIRDHERTYSGNVILNWFIDPNTFVDSRLSYAKRNIPLHFQPESMSMPSYSDAFTQMTWGAPYLYNNEEHKMDRIQAAMSITRFQDNFLGGNHEFKAGFEFGKGNSSWDSWKENHRLYPFWNGDTWWLAPRVSLYFTQICGYEPGEFVLKNNSLKISGYIQDSFTIKDRITFNLGLRYDEYHGTQPATSKYPDRDPIMLAMFPEYGEKLEYPEIKNIYLWRNLSPRLGISWDVFGNGKTSVKASYGRYAESLMIDYYNRFGQIAADMNIFLWIDANGNKIEDPVGVDMYIPTMIQDITPAPERIDKLREEGSKAPFTDEFILGISHELVKDFSIKLSFIHKTKKGHLMTIDGNIGYPFDMDYFVPYTVNDPGWDGEFGTDDDKQINLYAKKLNSPQVLHKVAHVPEFRRKYRALEFVFNKRMSNRWQFLGSIVWSKLWGDVQSRHDYTGWGFFMHPNTLINSYGRLDFDRPLVIKIQATYILPGNISLSGYFRHFDGAPFTRRLYIYFPQTINGVPVESMTGINADPLGSKRRQSSDILDIRIEKIFNLNKYGKIRAALDIFNILGYSAVTVDTSAGGYIFPDGSFLRYPYYGDILSAGGQRLLRVTLRYSF
jgi:outer membrane receptor protein involved in Fe transport